MDITAFEAKVLVARKSESSTKELQSISSTSGINEYI